MSQDHVFNKPNVNKHLTLSIFIDNRLTISRHLHTSTHDESDYENRRANKCEDRKLITMKNYNEQKMTTTNKCYAVEYVCVCGQR